MKFFIGSLISGWRRLISRFQRPLTRRSFNRKVRYIASLDEVNVIRDDHCARIEYKEEGIAATLLPVGPEIARMSDGNIVELHNKCLREDARQAAAFKQIACEVPLGSAQIEYLARCDQWVPRGRVLRCLIRDDERGALLIKIDKQELRLKQFAKLLTTYEGWGMRIEFVPENEVYRRPMLEVREPNEEE